MQLQLFAPLPSEPDTLLQRVEVASFFQIPGFQIIGLPAPEVAEAKERIRAAIANSKLEFPKKRIVLNLSPAAIRKRGTGLDLPMALAVVLEAEEAQAQRKEADLECAKVAAWGELGLDGETKGAGQVFRVVHGAWKQGLRAILVSGSEWKEALESRRLIQGAGGFQSAPPEIWPCANLADAWEALRLIKKRGSPVCEATRPVPKLHFILDPTPLLPLPLSLERWISCATAGRHHLLLLGPRGAGKSQALEWRSRLEPEPDLRTEVERRLILDLAPGIFRADLVGQVPIRRIGSQARPQALFGSAGAGFVRPGEFSLASGGLLLADELPEWPRDSREALREPLERKAITLTRVQGSVHLPADFTLAATGNACPCGGVPAAIAGWESPTVSMRLHGLATPCRCKETSRKAYLERLSGPILDRIDLSIWVSPRSLDTGEDQNITRLESLKAKVAAIRQSLVQSWGAPPGALTGAELEGILNRYPDTAAELSRLPLSSLRSRHKILRVALTLAAWDGQKGLLPARAQFQEALRLRGEGLIERLKAGSA